MKTVPIIFGPKIIVIPPNTVGKGYRLIQVGEILRPDDELCNLTASAYKLKDVRWIVVADFFKPNEVYQVTRNFRCCPYGWFRRKIV